MMTFVHRITCLTTATLLLSGFVQVAVAQDVPLPNVPRIKYLEQVLETLSKSDTSTIEHNRTNDEFVLELLGRYSDKAKKDKRCKLTPDSKYFGYFYYSIGQLQKKLGRKEGKYYPVDVYLSAQANGWVHGHRCGSDELKTTSENAVAYALGGQEPVPYALNEEKIIVTKIRHVFIDYYCRTPGRYDPACANLVGFMMGRPEPSCSKGLMIPAAPEPPKVVRCIYEMPISKDTRRKFNRYYTYWHQRVPNNLNSLRVYGVDQFSSIAPVAVEACPTNHREAATLSGDRHGIPIFGYPGEKTGMPEPPRSVRSPRCE